MRALNRRQRERFVEEGYLVLDSRLPRAALDRAVRELEGRYAPVHNGRGHLEPTRLQDAWHVCPSVHRIAVAPRVRAALRDLYGREPRPFQTLNFPVGTCQAPHADALHFNSAPAGFMAGVWVALEDVGRDCGPLTVFPGSHRIPEFTMADVGVASREELYGDYEAFVAGVIRTFGLEPQRALLRRGQALIWSSNLLHGGEERQDPSRSRHSQVTHYFFEGCRYYTPMTSRGLDVTWRDPEFLPPRLDTRPWLKRLTSRLRGRPRGGPPVG